MSEEHKLEVHKEEAETPEGVEHTRPGRTYVPRVDILEDENGFVVLADMPGVGDDSVDITLEKNVLTIHGGVDFQPPEGFDLAHAEYGIGDYHRAFTISNEVDRENIEATLSDGVLRLVLPRAPEAGTKKIQVQAG